MVIHVVRSGETLFSIAEFYNTSVELLIQSNGLPNPNRLAVGQCIVIAYPKIIHEVIAGETLASIASRYDVSVNSLYRNNPKLNSKPYIQVGDVLIIEYFDEVIANCKTGGYAYTSIDNDVLRESLPFLDYIMPFTYGFTQDGTLVPLDDNIILTESRLYGTLPYLHLSTLTENGVFSSTLASSLLHNSYAISNLLDNVLSEIQSKGYQGLDVDFEFLPASDSMRYADFISLARQRLNPLGIEVLTALAPKTSDNQIGALYEGHDYLALGDASNYVLIMSYEWGYTYGPPMAVSPIPSIRRVLNYAVSRIPKYKIFMGISNYGYDWPLPYVKGQTRARSISTDTALLLASQNKAEIFFDENAKAPYFYYTDTLGTTHEVWFEDARSIKAKLELCAEYGFRGVLDWNIDRRNRQNLLMMNLLFLGNR